MRARSRCILLSDTSSGLFVLFEPPSVFLVPTIHDYMTRYRFMFDKGFLKRVWRHRISVEMHSTSGRDLSEE